MINYEKLIDQLMQIYTQDKYKKDVEEGRADFFEGTGFLDETNPNFEMKMIQFGEWYLFNRPLIKSEKTPVMTALEDDQKLFSTEDIERLKNMVASRHSIFEFVKFVKNDMHIRDLFSKYKHIIKSSPLKHGFNKGDYFEARIIPHEDSFCFTRAFCFHPVEANKYIQSKVKQIQKMAVEDQLMAREKFIFKIFKMKNRYEQYAHVAADKIYTDSVGHRI